MKKFEKLSKALVLFLSLLFVSSSASSQKALRDSVLVKSDIFTIMYSEKLEQPLWIRYTVLCPTGKALRAGMDFYTNDTVHTSNNEDYANNIYDKGHMAPAADFNCNTQMLIKTFSYINCALQNQYLNRGAWRLLETRERQLALTGDVSVLITLYFGKNRLATGATVPVSFKKQISHKGKTECYFFLNERPVSSNYLDYKCK
jgi:DNA/RNA endonuclease G (NUC1)